MADSSPDTVPGLVRGSCFGQQRVHHTRLSKMCVSVNLVDATCHHCERFTFTGKTKGPPKEGAPQNQTASSDAVLSISTEFLSSSHKQ